jgi:hypothetical protein
VGHLTYGSSLTIHFDDRTLAHLQAAIGAKLLLRDSFYLNWAGGSGGDGSRGTIWIHPGVPLHYTYIGTTWRALNPTWVDALVRSANQPDGMTVTAEP